MKVSRDSIRRLLRLYLGLNESRFIFHQTLTFREKQTDLKLAKASLKQLLDLLGKRYEMVTLYAHEYQERGSLHFQVLFLFYDDSKLPFPANRMETEFPNDVFSQWNRINLNRLSQEANKVTFYRVKPDFVEYVTRDNEVQDSGWANEVHCHWWGYRKIELIQANSTPVEKAIVKAEMNRLCPILKLRPPVSSPVPRSEPKAKRWDKRDLREMRGYVEGRGKYDWKSYKDGESRKRNCSDEDFLRFLNGESLAPPPPKRPSHKKKKPLGPFEL